MLNRKDASPAVEADIIRKQAAEIARLQGAKRRALAIADARAKENAALRAEIKRLRGDAEKNA